MKMYLKSSSSRLVGPWAPKTAKIAPRRLMLVGPCASKTAKIAPRRFKLEVKMAQDTAKRGQDGGLVGHWVCKTVKTAIGLLCTALGCSGPLWAALGCSALLCAALGRR